MTPRAFFITLLLSGCLYLLIQGAWDFTKHQAEWRKEKKRLEQFAAVGIEMEGMKNEIQKKIYLAAGMAIVGAFGIFVYISRSTRKQVNYPINRKNQIQP